MPLIDIEHTFYLRLRHVIKAHARVKFSVSTSRASFRSLLDNLRHLYARLDRLNPEDVGGYRIELRFRVRQCSTPSISQAIQWLLNRNKFSLDSYPDLSFTIVDYEDYLNLVDYSLLVAEKLKLAVGDNNSKLPTSLHYYSAYLINLFGETNPHAQPLFDKGREAFLYFSQLYRQQLEFGTLRSSVGSSSELEAVSDDSVPIPDRQARLLEPSDEDTSYGGIRLTDELVRQLYRQVAWRRPFSRKKDKTGTLSYSVKKGCLPAGAKAPGTFNTYASAMKDILSQFKESWITNVVLTTSTAAKRQVFHDVGFGFSASILQPSHEYRNMPARTTAYLPTYWIEIDKSGLFL
ncbi:hypothetical protein Pmar_PMAR008784 [Perkinsus marinus ATCC 50983]|uniref:Uncharacterized protein n=1 Tax=Perkinsus marinus (strain ATCC 50983 / TXsc) TaxID=423536 RepID=C5L103_PERM5|nr:hypothetical protein Pmar_PMAR008784 [Perkinsus marinus ATCC 50983]EER09645.1 hypothetical protein Pmar_PMAR008784 [Perkinsus marinus ATCC 50983]|eukprot:XP_002777850.1 hypothetical protein Pmar_PMAR008784 [Perkinsus marinus ATCC 50983]